MTRALAHRGPDDEGLYLPADGPVGMGARRLAIVDLSSAGHQPMSNEDGTIWLSFNGEIYNHVELRRELVRIGHVYRSHADTETVLHLYEEEGEACVERLHGMYAFAIWDSRQQRLVLARDRIGIKPLYYTRVGDLFLFASEIKSLLCHPRVNAQVDEQGLYHYLTFVTTPPPRTLFKNIFKLPPGHLMIVEKDGQQRSFRYWHPLEAADEYRPEVLKLASSRDGLDRLAEELRDLLEKSIERRMMADVPFGVFLSGGVDSTTNVALMSRISSQPVRTFSVGFSGESAFDERDVARRVARHYNTDHHEVEIGDESFESWLPRMVYYQDEPLADPVCVPLYYVSKLARDSGTIVIQVGEGADELFCGYPGYVRTWDIYRRHWRAFRMMPKLFRRLSASLAHPFLDTLKREALERAVQDGELFWGGAIAFWEGEKRHLWRNEQLGNPRQDSSVVVRRILETAPRGSIDGDYLGRMIFLELSLRLPELLLMRVDKMTMATSVEARVPYLDHELVAFALALPAHLKAGNGQTKLILKRAVRGLVPDWVLQRPKMGFCGSSKNMLTPELLRHAEQKILMSPAIQEWFNMDSVRGLLRAHATGAEEASFRIWNLLNLALWAELWLEGRSIAAA